MQMLQAIGRWTTLKLCGALFLIAFSVLVSGCGSKPKHTPFLGLGDPDEQRIFYQGWLRPSTN